jgi:deoxyribodipyrimidine photo-lyase
MPIVVWFRQDLRLADNPGLAAAAERGHPILPVYILDEDAAGDWAEGGASKWWLHKSLIALHAATEGALRVYTGGAEAVLTRLVKQEGVNSVYWNRCYEPWRIARDSAIKLNLRDNGIEVQSYNGSLLFEPKDVLKDDGTPWKVFTPFYKRGYLPMQDELRKPGRKPANICWHQAEDAFDMEALELLGAPAWHEKLQPYWSPGEAGARQQLKKFVRSGITGYQDNRNIPAAAHTSTLSPHLHFGELSPNQVWFALDKLANDKEAGRDVELFRRQLIWREFSYHLLYHWPQFPNKNWQSKFDAFPWLDDEAALHRWQKGETGYPIVDAGMRELWETGYMHNRVRMIVGSFLVKNLLIHWRHGEDWFWDTLLDADLANNSASWQWVAGSGADAAPYFRIFNPVTQGGKFDADGSYVRRWIPELADLPDKWLHKPWEADSAILADAGITLGDTYPEPMVELKASRDRALEAFAATKGA